jgi:hypothetical protein
MNKGLSHIARHMNRALDMAVLPDVSASPIGAWRSSSISLGRSRPGAIVLAMLVAAANMTSCGSDTQNPQLANGWVTNCSGPEFSKFSQTDGAGPVRPVFRINDQLVLAVPKGNSPSAGRIEREPRVCRTISDLPRVPYLYFVIQGNWSGNYNPNDVPLDGGRKKFLPDIVTVRIERDLSGASTGDEQRKVEQIGSKFRNDLFDKQEIGGLTCGRTAMPPHPGYEGGLLCWGHLTSSDPDTLAFSAFAYEDMTPFVWIDAHRRSKHYGGIQVYWQVWTLDVAHGRDIDQAIWKKLTEWNLIEENDAASSVGSEMRD